LILLIECNIYVLINWQVLLQKNPSEVKEDISCVIFTNLFILYV